MKNQTEFLNKLGITKPLFLAPMAGGPGTSDLAVAACEAGALGALACAYQTPDVMREHIQQVRARTSQPFLINLFVPHTDPMISEKQFDLAVQATASFRKRFGISTAPLIKPPYSLDFEKQFEEVLRARPAAFSFVFGIPEKKYLEAAHHAGILIIGTATNLDEAQQLVDAKVDAIVAQGFEAGGHRGIFDAHAPDPEIKTKDLVIEITNNIDLPVIAAGGIMTPDDIRSMLDAGAVAVQMGTAFLATSEAGTASAYKEKLLQSDVRSTRTTRAFSGRLARGLINEFMNSLDEHPESILPFPIQNNFTRDLRAASAKSNSSEAMSLWSGTGPGHLWTGSAKELIAALF